MITEKEKMLAGKLYDTTDSQLLQRREKARILCVKFNMTTEDQAARRAELIDELIPNKKENCYIQGPIFCDYGDNLFVGKNFCANFNFTVLDCCPITIGDNAFIGPNVSLLTPVHALRYQERNVRVKSDGTIYDLEYAKPITIGDNCWISGNVTILGGVNIGQGCVIGAGSVVTKDIPDDSLAFGNPCKVIRKITEEDSVYLKKDLF
ncbi:MAG: sugar O-acetyltransferase [Bacilli bacterium]|jgi:maltose O-acetyltransferase